MGSLFDGIGGFPLAAVHNGIIPIWASEIELFPIEVTKMRFPDMIHVGDITKLDGAKLPPVEIICGGSPCQDLSVAGKRAGLQGEQSGLFMEQIRIVKEMRAYDKANGRTDDTVRPRYMVWENVPGAFSSAKGEDFRAVLEETCRIADSTVSIPRPPRGVWKSAGAILGDEFSVAWRVYDAQYWSVPQRRKRIFLVADFGGHTAPQILFEQDRLFGDSAPSEETWQGAAICTKAGIRNSGGNTGTPGGTTGECLTSWDAQSRRIYREDGIWPSLYASEGGGNGYVSTEKNNQAMEQKPVVFACNQRDEVRDLGDVAGAIQAQLGMKQQTFVAETADITAFHINQRDEVIDLNGISGALLATRNMQMQTFISDPVLCLNDQGGERMDATENITATLRAQMDGHPPLVLGNQPELFENHAKDARYTGPHKVAPTMTARYGTGGNNIPLITQPTVFQDKEYTDLPHAETYCIAGNIIDRQDHNGGNGIGVQPNISYTVTTSDRHAIFSQQSRKIESDTYQQVVGALCRGDEKGIGSQYVSQDKCIVENKQMIRRLTPLECERLQGFPDYWTDIPGASDSARYKALGNSVAIPCVEHVLRGIAYFLRKSKEKEVS